ncbi:hypothetical protein RugamoR57_48800 [Duganella caerulea]|uniref:PD-(D/E)XK nuclease family protein n=1 Tax=Duganella caerulea TaxID=2885762 RepID=UPI0030E8CD4D
MAIRPVFLFAWNWVMIVACVSTFVVLIVFCAVVLRIYRAMLREEQWLPKEFVTAKLMFSEQMFSGPSHAPVVARVDRAYWAEDQLHLVELKRRGHAKIYATDVIELSAQRLAVHAATGMHVSIVGVVVVEHPVTGRRTAMRVKLLAEDRVINLMRRRDAILAGVERPEETCLRARCIACEYRNECKGESGAKVYPLIRSTPD